MYGIPRDFIFTLLKVRDKKQMISLNRCPYDAIALQITEIIGELLSHELSLYIPTQNLSFFIYIEPPWKVLSSSKRTSRWIRKDKLKNVVLTAVHLVSFDKFIQFLVGLPIKQKQGWRK